MTDPFKPLDREPATIMTGSYTAWRISNDIDPLEYSLKYAFIQGNQRVELAGSYVENCWQFTATGAFSTTLSNGRHNLHLIAVRISDAEEALVATSTIFCYSSLAERQSHAQVMVDKIESILTGRADDDVSSYTIKSRSITKMSVPELTSWREYYLAELGRESDPVTGRRRNDNTLKVGFV